MSVLIYSHSPRAVLQHVRFCTRRRAPCRRKNSVPITTREFHAAAPQCTSQKNSRLPPVESRRPVSILPQQENLTASFPFILLIGRLSFLRSLALNPQRWLPEWARGPSRTQRDLLRRFLTPRRKLLARPEPPTPAPRRQSLRGFPARHQSSACGGFGWRILLRSERILARRIDSSMRRAYSWM